MPELAIKLEFADAVESPYFVLGETTPAQWNNLRRAPAPWAELVGRNIILHVPSDQVREMDDPTALLEWWDKVVTAEDSLVGWPTRTVQERLVPDRQISGGFMHSGYPIMCHMKSGEGMTNLAELREGGWGFFHELGHNHQSRDWTFQKPFSQTEVTCNLFSLYCSEHICNQPRGVGHKAIAPHKLLDLLDRRLGGDGGSPFDQLAPFIALLHQYGWEPLQQTLASYQTEPNPNGSTEEERQAEFVRRYSKHAKANLSGFFERLGYACPPKDDAELRDLAAFDYEAWRKQYEPRHPRGSENNKEKQE
jgi:hypothetical protein